MWAAEGGPTEGGATEGGPAGRGRGGGPLARIGDHRPKLAKSKVVTKVSLAVAKVGLVVAKVGRGQTFPQPLRAYEHLLPHRDNVEDCSKFFEISQAFAQAKFPEEIVSALRVGQMTALQKANGEIQGIVVGDVIRRLVAKTLAKQFMTRFKDATKPFQYTLSTQAGCESIAHVVQVMTDRDPNCTVLSIHGVGAFDLVSRSAMMTPVHSMD